MKKINTFLIVIFTAQFINAQHQASNWYFGYNAGITFNTNPPSFLIGGSINNDEGCSSVSDNSGNLIMYSDGVRIYNSSHAVIQNGSGLLGHSSSTQSAVIVPLPGSSTIFYVFTTPWVWTSDPMCYSIVDMAQNNGLGRVTVKNYPILSQTTEKLTAIAHQNGTDVWIVGHGQPNNNFYAFLLTSFGLTTVPIVSSVGDSIIYTGSMGGYLKSSHSGNKLANVRHAYPSQIELYDFNNFTGVVSNPLVIAQFSYESYGVEFSPDDSKLYTTISDYPSVLIQFDLSGGSLASIIASMDSIYYSNEFLGALQMGPDGKIYLARNNKHYLGCITHPNLAGNSCSYVDSCVFLGNGYGRFGLPCFLNSFFNNTPSFIDSPFHKENFSCFPNPFSSNMTLSFKKNNSRETIISVKNIFGFEVYHYETKNFDFHEKTFDFSVLSNGIYLFDITTDNEKALIRLIKQ